jgi:DNA-binding response OmpR family regulator
VTLLVVEDEARIASFLVKGLAREGYDVDAVPTGAEALMRARDPTVDLVILDLGLADIDGLDVLSQLRTTGYSVPVLILTARAGAEYAADALRRGADDYLTKPFAFQELLVRIRACLRARDRNAAPIEAGDVRLDPRTLRTDVGGAAVLLTAREVVLLRAFLSNPGRVLSLDQLIEDVWTAAADAASSVEASVSDLRKRLGGGRIEAVGAGYRFSAAR